ncbi:MAG TPA: hypothetical protein VHE61_07030 [Opitutaceae bacterium]|nr:hypothetical protein [Opitutaceae bacterium]
MSNNEAKFLLNACRPNGRDASDPAFAAAMAQARSDPALGAWFAQEQAHGAAVAAKLQEIAPPPGLREAILAGGRATQRAAAVRPRRPMVTWGALAACFAALIAASVALWPARAPAANALTSFALYDVAYGRHGGRGEATAELAQQLGSPATHLSAGLPIDFSRLKNTGCRTLQVAGHSVLEVCFVRNGAEFHCYIGRAADFHVGAPAAVQFVQQAGLTAAAWTKGSYRFVVVGGAGLDAVKRLL